MKSIVIAAAVATTAIVPMRKAHRRVYDPKFIAYGTRGDTTIAFEITDSSFVTKDSLLLLQQKKGSDTVLTLAYVSAAPLLVDDSTVLSQDTLTDVRVVRKK